MKAARGHVYIGVPSAQLPIRYSATNLPPPPLPAREVEDEMELEMELEMEMPADTGMESAPVTSSSSGESTHSEWKPKGGPASYTDKPRMVSQDRLDWIVSKLELSQRKSEELASFLYQENLLAPDAKVTAFRKRQSVFQDLFIVNKRKTFAYCKNIPKLMEKMGIAYKPHEWRLFIDSSKNSLKVVLLHMSNKKPSVPIAYCTDTKETYEKMKIILKKIKYEKYQWRICCDLKMVAILRGLQPGYTNHMCYLCNWNTRNKRNQYQDHSWELRQEHTYLQHNVIKPALVPEGKILMPYLHVKLGVVKSFLKTIVQHKKTSKHARKIFKHLKKMFHISDAKIKEGM